MTTTLSSPFAQPDPTLPICEGSPQIARPTKEEVEAFPDEAQKLVTNSWATQKMFYETGAFDLHWLEGRHILLAGATGAGIGGGLATAVLGLGTAASVTIVARDLKRSLGYETGKVMQEWASASGMGERFSWLNEGMALEGKPLEKIVETLKAHGAERVVYFNTVAAAISGLLPGFPSVFVKDIGPEGLFQWQLLPLNEKEIQITEFVMGEMAVQFPDVLAANGITVEAAVYSDWRGSLDKISRDPAQPEYGRHGAYSTSLYLPKETLRRATRAAYRTNKLVRDIFLPAMRTRALSLIPGGTLMVNIDEKLMEKENIRPKGVPELALGVLDRTGRALVEGDDNPFPRLDNYDLHLDEWFFEVIARLNTDENSDFYYKRWIMDNPMIKG